MHIQKVLKYPINFKGVFIATPFVEFTFTFIHLADAFLQSDLQMRTIEAVKLTIAQSYASVTMTLPSLITQYLYYYHFFIFLLMITDIE